MPGVALDEIVDCDNPLLQFFYQSAGRMADVVELKFSVRLASSASFLITDQAVDVTDCSTGGDKLSLGRYVAAFTATKTGPTVFIIGTHEIVWKFKVTAPDPERIWRQRFEVLDESEFPTGAGYRTYVDTTALSKNDELSAFTVSEMQVACLETAERIEQLTGNILEPRFIRTRYNSTNSGALPLSHPIIGIASVDFVAGGPAESILTIDLNDFVIYNRHLDDGLVEPDDRHNPRIEFGTSQLPGEPSFQGLFLHGRQSVEISGVFGYTDFDGTPVGSRPRLLARAAGILTSRLLLDPFGNDVFTSQPGRIRGARTRDQAVTFASATEGATGPLTGDRIVDDLLMRFRRPPYIGGTARIVRERASKVIG